MAGHHTITSRPRPGSPGRGCRRPPRRRRRRATRPGPRSPGGPSSPHQFTFRSASATCAPGTLGTQQVEELVEGAAVNEHGGYARRWRRVWGWTIAVSLAPAALVVHPLALLAAAGAGALVAVVAALVISTDLEEPFASRVARVRTAALWGAGIMSAVVFIGTVSGQLLLVLLLLALMSSPSALSAAQGVVGPLTRSPRAGADPLPVDLGNREVLAKLTNAELGQAWRSTHERLQAAPSAPELAAYARLRQLLLEELEKRNPQAVTTWLSRGGDAREAPAA